MTTEWRAERVDLTNNITTITAVPCLVKGVYINSTLSAHACEIKNGSSSLFTIPASAAAGTSYGFGPARYEDSLVVDPDDSGTGNLTVVYVPLREDRY